MTNVHDYTVHQCTLHSIKRYPAGMFYWVCDCGIHSQCFASRKLATVMGNEHIAQTRVPSLQGVQIGHGGTQYNRF